MVRGNVAVAGDAVADQDSVAVVAVHAGVDVDVLAAIRPEVPPQEVKPVAVAEAAHQLP